MPRLPRLASHQPEEAPLICELRPPAAELDSDRERPSMNGYRLTRAETLGLRRRGHGQQDVDLVPHLAQDPFGVFVGSLGGASRPVGYVERNRQHLKLSQSQLRPRHDGRSPYEPPEVLARRSSLPVRCESQAAELCPHRESAHHTVRCSSLSRPHRATGLRSLAPMENTVTVIATVVVAIATIVYAWLTWHLAKEARTSSQAAVSAAESAADSARSAAQSLEISQAPIVVNFDNRLRFSSEAHRAWLAVRPVGANIYLVGVEAAVMLERKDGTFDSARHWCYGPDAEPHQHLAGVSGEFDWREPDVTPHPDDRRRIGSSLVHYRLAPDATTRTAFVEAPVEIHPPFV